MAADQWRKRLNTTTIATCYGREPYRAKRKNSGLSQHDSNMKSHISLEWDGNQKKVVARREQIGVSWRDVRPFAGSSTCVNNVMADVFALPHEIYALENLKEVLSYEVWEAYLSESERNHLMQFLPSGLEAEQVLQALLAGDNFHFGSPFLNWSSSLCSGDLHPDAIHQQHQYLKNEKKAYCAQLHKYHNNMLGNLLKLKERFEHCKDPEKEIVQKKWRSRNDMDKRISPFANDSRFNVLEDNAVASSDSCSWNTDEKACSSDNQNPSVFKGGELHNRLCKKDALKDKGGNPSVVSSDVHNTGAKPRKGDKKHQQNNSCNDGAKYMSYFKISKKQHEIVKNMKQSGKSIQSKSLNRVLGNIDSFDVQPYQVFIEEEQKKLREYWIQMANKALPAACVKWRDLNSQRQQLRKSLEQEMKERSKMLIENEDDSDSHKTVLGDLIENGVEDHIRTLEEDDEKSVSGSLQQESQQEFSSEKQYDSMDIDSEKEAVTKSDHATPNVSDNANTADVDLSQGVQLSCSGDVWPAANISHSYYDSTASHEYTSDDGLTIAPPKGNEEQQTDLIELESSLQVGETGKDVVHRQPEDTSFRQSDDASFDSYSNQDRNDLFQSLFKGDGMLIYHHEQKQTGLDFHSTNHMLVEDGQFPGHFQEQPHPVLPIERMHKRENDAYVQNMAEHVYSDGGRFLIPRQETLVGVDVHDWAVNSVRVAPPMQSHLNGELPNWFSGEHQVRGGWTASGGASVPSQSIGSRNGGDQSLYSVLSQCNQLRSGSPYQAAASSAEQFIPVRNYGMMGGSTTNPGMSNVPPQSLEYMSGREAGPSLMGDDMGWMGLAQHQHQHQHQHQNSGLHDPMGKPYLRSWNQ